MSKHLDLISDQMAINICNMAADVDSSEVIDRIYGITVGLFGKYNEIDVMEFYEIDNGVTINRPHRHYGTPTKIRSKRKIRGILRAIGVQEALFNVPHRHIEFLKTKNP